MRARIQDETPTCCWSWTPDHGCDHSMRRRRFNPADLLRIKAFSCSSASTAQHSCGRGACAAASPGRGGVSPILGGLVAVHTARSKPFGAASTQAATLLLSALSGSAKSSRPSPSAGANSAAAPHFRVQPLTCSSRVAEAFTRTLRRTFCSLGSTGRAPRLRPVAKLWHLFASSAAIVWQIWAICDAEILL